MELCAFYNDTNNDFVLHLLRDVNFISSSHKNIRFQCNGLTIIAYRLLYEVRSAGCPDAPSNPRAYPVLQCTVTPCLHPNVAWIVWFCYATRLNLGKRYSESGDCEPCIVKNLYMFFWVTWITTPLWRHNGSSVTTSVRNMDTNMCQLKILCLVSFLNFSKFALKSIVFQKQILVICVRIIAPYGEDNLGNDINEDFWIWILWLPDISVAEFWNVFKCCALFKSMCDISSIAENHFSDGHANQPWHNSQHWGSDTCLVEIKIYASKLYNESECPLSLQYIYIYTHTHIYI